MGKKRAPARAAPPSGDGASKAAIPRGEQNRVELEQLEQLEQVIAAIEASLPAGALRDGALQPHLEHRAKLLAVGATVVGSGASAFGDGAMSVGSSAVGVGGSVGGDVLGAGARKTETHVHAATRGPAAKSLRDQYLNQLLAEEGRVDLAALSQDVILEENKNPPRLESIYTALRVRAAADAGARRDGPSPERQELPSALSQVNQHRRLVLLGDPGSGKSTFVRFLAVCMAGELLGVPSAGFEVLRQPLPGEDGEPNETRQPWSVPALLPVLVVLRDFAAGGLPPIGEEATAEHLWSFLEARIEKRGPKGFDLRRHLGDEGGLVLFDGLDEVPEAQERRAQLVEALKAFTDSQPRCRFVVTSRTYAYQDDRWHLPDFPAVELAPFGDGEIRRFVRLWYGDAVGRGSVPEATAALRQQLLESAIFRHRHIRELAARPLLLTLMASLHAYGGEELPERRVALYERTVQLLLVRWERERRLGKGAGARWESSLSSWLETGSTEILAALAELAFEAHGRQRGAEGTADVPEGRLLERLMDLCRQPGRDLRELRDYLRDRAGILLPRGDKVYTFPHRSFQEYLAACHLTRGDLYPQEIARLARQEPERWREVALLAGAKACLGNQGPLWDLAEALCWRGPEEASADAADLWGAQVAGQALAESVKLAEISPAREPKLERARSWLQQILQGDELAARERALAGQSLAVLEDPRLSVTSLEGMELCWVPAGRFVMGSPKDDPESREEERRQHEVEMAYGYWLGRFPVTVGQWREYAASPGVEIEEEGSLRGAANVPMTEVSWHEALGFCSWLTARWRALGLLPADWEVRLPSEAEWEKAARGGLRMPVDRRVGAIREVGTFSDEPHLWPNPEPRRRYPWGDRFDAELANAAQTGIGEPNSVGCFSGGASVYGCEEMAGNVWEWTRSLWGEDWNQPDHRYPYSAGDGRERLDAPNEVLRVLRGGSYILNPRSVRCAFRLRDHPYARNSYVGFRVMLSPIPSSDL